MRLRLYYKYVIRFHRQNLSVIDSKFEAIYLLTMLRQSFYVIVTLMSSRPVMCVCVCVCMCVCMCVCVCVGGVGGVGGCAYVSVDWIEY